MKTWQFRSAGYDNLALTDREWPTPKPNEVVVRIRAASLNYRDLLMGRGTYGIGRDWPLVPLSDAAGEVVGVGSDVTVWKRGDRVTTAFFSSWQDGPLTEEKAASALGGSLDGVLAEGIALPSHGVIATPSHMTDVEAACLPCAGVTAWNALFEGETPLVPGDTVLVQGTGGVSIFGIQLAKLAGARVIVTSSSDEKLQKAKQVGADVGINYHRHSEWHREVSVATSGRGVDHVLDVAGVGTLEQSLKCVSYGGQVSLIGVLSGGVGAVSVAQLAERGARVRRIFVGSSSMLERLSRALTLHRSRPVVDRIFSFAEAPDAFRFLESGAHIGKVVVEI